MAAFPESVTPEDLLTTAEAAGCQARLPEPPADDDAVGVAEDDPGSILSHAIRRRRAGTRSCR